MPLVLNARTDVFIGQVGDPATRLERAVERGRAYLEAGADCIFVPGRRRSGADRRARRGIGGPVSVLAVPGSPTLAELAALGVARISVGSGRLPRRARARAQRMAEEAYGEGSLDAMTPAQVSFADAQALFER